MTDASLHGLVAAVRRYDAAHSAPAELAALRRIGLRPLAGGRNNSVYAASLHGEQLCVKLPVVDERGRAEREWQALQLLAVHLPGLAPVPLLYDPDPGQPVVVMQLLPGWHLGGRRLNRRQLGALTQLHAKLHQITPATAATPLPAAVSQPAALLRRVGSFWGSSARSGPAPPWYSQAVRLWQNWSAGADPAVLLTPTPLVFGHGDPSLANYLWDGRRLTIVDFEYAGWRDRAIELADLVEHAQARKTPTTSWVGFVDLFDLDDHEHARYQPARRLFAFFWLTLLQPQPGRKPARLHPAVQLRRIGALLEAR